MLACNSSSVCDCQVCNNVLREGSVNSLPVALHVGSLRTLPTEATHRLTGGDLVAVECSDCSLFSIACNTCMFMMGLTVFDCRSWVTGLDTPTTTAVKRILERQKYIETNLHKFGRCMQAYDQVSTACQAYNVSCSL